MNGISVIICCYNSATRLPQTLKHLIAQVGLENIPSEILIVNNNSNDNTIEVSKNILNDSSIQYKIVDELQPGQFHARIKGINESKYDILVFVDDDNWLEENYLKNAYEIIKNNPTVGLCGGVCEGAFENEPPIWFKHYEGAYAIGDGKRKIEGILPKESSFLYGAGLVVRKLAYEDLLNKGFKPILGGRNGKILSSGDDSELCAAINILGWKSYFSRNLKFKHFIPQNRLTLEYFYRLLEGFGSSSQVMTIYNLVLLDKNPIYFYYFRRLIKLHLDFVINYLKLKTLSKLNNVNPLFVKNSLLKHNIINNYQNLIMLSKHIKLIKKYKYPYR